MTLNEIIKKYKPMLANTGKPFNSFDYIYEIKWDGIRCIMIILSKKVNLISRNGNLLDDRYPELAELSLVIDEYPIILDGEIVYFQDDGKPNFQRLLARDRLRKPELIKRQSKETPVVYMVFDILRLGDKELVSLPLSERKEILKSTVKKIDDPKIKLSDYIPDNGVDFYNAVKELGLEGVMAKAKSSKYLPGKRTELWQKIKCINSDEFIICGYISGLRSGLGSLVLGQYNLEGEIIYRGQVGTGFTEKDAEILKEYLDEIKVSKKIINNINNSSKIIWVKPLIVASVEYLELTNAGILRHPSFKGIRTDKESLACIARQ